MGRGGSVESPLLPLVDAWRTLWASAVQGEVHEVTVLKNGYRWQGQRYRSLSRIAEEITGAHWSGPRFFGTTKGDP